MRGSDRSDAARCSAFRRRDSWDGPKLDGVRSLKDAGEMGDANGNDSDLPLNGGGWAVDGKGGVGSEDDDEDTIAMRCLEGGGTLLMVGML